MTGGVVNYLLMQLLAGRLIGGVYLITPLKNLDRCCKDSTLNVT